jgi:hypothetical protein
VNLSHSKTAVSILCVCVLLYIPVQWIGGRRPGSTSIFSAQHHALEQQFRDATATLRQQLIDQCVHHGVHDIYFSDADVISPYLVGEVQAQPACILHRETLVTPELDSPKLACSAVIVDEAKPNAWFKQHVWEDLNTLEGKVVSVGSFAPPDNQFDFMLLRASNCAHSDAASALASLEMR